MATISVTTGTVNHTLPAKFWGFNFSIGFQPGDLNQAQYRQFIQELAPEVWRTHDFRRSNGALYSGFNTAKTFMQQVLPNAAAIINPDSGPATLPSTTNACSTTNLAANGSGRSPVDHSNLLAAWLDAGIDVQLYEFCNEPWGHCTPATPVWYGGTSANPDGYKCESWVSIHQRDFYTPLASVISARSASTEVGGHVFATSEGYGFSWTQSFIDADAIQGACTSPYAGSGGNLPYFDTYVFHGYSANPDGTNQGRVSSLLVDKLANPPTNGTSLYTKLLDTRAKLDAVGGTAKGIAWDEAGLNATTALAGLHDAINAIVATRYQAQFKIKRFCLHSGNTGSTSSPQFPIFTTADHTNFTRTARSYQLRDITSPFIRLYKRQCVPAISGSGTTPGTFPVQRIQAAAGLNAAGDTLAVLVANVDLTNPETVTINLDATPAGSAQVTFMLQSTGNTAMPKTTVAPVGGAFTRTIEAGAVYLFEVPLLVGGGGDVTPPTLSSVVVVDDATIVQTFSETLSGSTPAAGDFTVNRNGSSVAASSVTRDGADQVNLHFPAGTFDSNASVTVTWTRGVDMIEDSSGNAAAAYSNVAATNIVPPPENTDRRFIINGRQTIPGGRVQGRTKTVGGGGI